MTTPINTLTPGAPLTVARSVAAPTPTTVAWASTGVIDFVADCGADPTGVADIGGVGGPIDVAANLMNSLSLLLVPGLTLTLFIPPGLYSCRTTPTVQNFATVNGDIRIVGSGDAGIIQVGVGGTGFVFPWTNMPRLFVENITFVGTTTSEATPDCQAVFFASPFVDSYVEGCKFFWILASNAVFQSNGGGYFHACEFGGCGILGTAGQGGAIWSPYGQGQVLSKVTFTDTSVLLGFSFAGLFKPGLNGANVAWLRCDGSNAPTVGVPSRIVVDEDCYFDEDIQHQIIIDGAAGAVPGVVPYVRISSTHFNSPTVGGSPATGASVVINAAELVEFIGNVNSGFNVDDAGAALALTSVAYTKVHGLITNASAASNYVTADSNCGYVEFVDCPSLIQASGNVNSTLQSNAKLTRAKCVDGSGSYVWADLVTIDSSSSCAPWTPMKIASSGAYEFIKTTDEAWQVAGIGMTVALGGQKALVARGVQALTVAVDGAVAMSPGDPMTVSTVNNAQLAKAFPGASPKGIVATALASVGGSGPTTALALVQAGIVEGETSSWSQATWFVDPQNSSGLASDANTGIDAMHPVLSYNGGIATKWGTTSPVLEQDTQIIWMSAASDGDGDPVILTPTMVGTVLTIVGALDPAQNLLTSGTLSSVTTKDRSAGQLTQVDLGASVPVGALVRNTTSGKESTCFVYQNVSGTVYTLTQPIAVQAIPIYQSSYYETAERDTWANGDTFEVWQPMGVNIVKLHPTVSAYSSPNWPSQLQTSFIRFLSAGGPAGDNCWVSNDVSISDCSIESCITGLECMENETSLYVNVFIESGAYNTTGSSYLVFMFAGALVSYSTASAVSWLLDLDVIIDSTYFSPDETNYGVTVGSTLLQTGDHFAMGPAYINGNLNVSCQADLAGGNALNGHTVLWGPGRLQVEGTARALYSLDDTAVATFGYLTKGITINNNTKANAFDIASGTWSAAIDITPANLDLAFGSGGFGGNCVNPGGGAIVSWDLETGGEGGGTGRFTEEEAKKRNLVGVKSLSRFPRHMSKLKK